ncbi:MAG: amidase family protein [Defluviitaleaceae bacterium]|nr:amidase family protein [Defluviitaleaceae bacterium]
MGTSENKVKDYIKKINESGLNSVIELNPKALEEAHKCDNSENKTLPLHGVPILIKDNVNTKGMITSAGSIALTSNITQEDAPIVKLIREAGAVILGKANMTEFANYMVDFRKDEKMPNGYSSRGGQCINPHGSEHDPSGSSTGSAVAVAAGLVSMAIGSETYGSIISPSQNCGIVGIKPTASSVSTEGVIPISHTLDILGPMTKTVDDAAKLLGVIQNKEYAVSPNRTARVGVYKHYMEHAKADWVEANKGLLDKMEALGMDIFHLDIEPIDERPVFPIMEYEFKHSINSYLKTYGAEGVPANLEEIIAYNNANSDIALKYGQGNLIIANEKNESWDKEKIYTDAIKERDEAIKQLDRIFDENNLDIIFLASAHCGVGAFTGFPTMTVPIGFTTDNAPIGCCILAGRDQEDILINVAKVIEDIIK